MRKIRHEAVVTPAKYSHFQRIMCPLPKVPIDDDYFTVGYEVSASNDRKTFSDIKHLTTYDSKCMECTADLECNQTVSEYKGPYADPHSGALNLLCPDKT